jgi:hypothetical protein
MIHDAQVGDWPNGTESDWDQCESSKDVQMNRGEHNQSLDKIDGVGYLI